MTKEIKIGDVIIFGRPESAFITIKENKKTTSVRWDVGGIDLSHELSQSFSRSCDKSGFLNDVKLWSEKWKASFTCRSAWWMSNRWGDARCISNESANELVSIIIKHFELATAQLQKQ